jgi:hypothetical protein
MEMQNNSMIQKRKKRMRIILFSLLIFIFLIAFYYDVTPPSAVLSDTSCQAPCWRNITMGMDEKQAISLLRGMGDIQQSTLKISQYKNDYFDEVVDWAFWGRQESRGEMLFRDSKVAMITFDERGYTFENQIFSNGIPLSGLIRKNNAPSQVRTSIGAIELTYINIIFLYADKGVCFTHTPSWPFYDPNMSTYHIGGSLKIQDIYYYDPKINMDKLNIGCVPQIDDYHLQKWKGYGDYILIH